MSDTSTILVAEDNDFVRMQIVKYLHDKNYNVLEASDGKQAQDVITKDKVDLAIVDVRMEPVGGFDFIRNVRAMDIKIPIILATGDNAPDILERSGDYGVSAVLIKPVQKERLLQAVERSLAMKIRKSVL
jgi:CheY-like chemotaxis protein